MDRADVSSQELVRILLDTVLGSLTPYARGFLLALPAGLVLLVASWWPRRARYDDEVVAWTIKQLEQAERVVFCYEAGPFGYSLARSLKQAGVEPVVMCAVQRRPAPALASARSASRSASSSATACARW